MATEIIFLAGVLVTVIVSLSVFATAHELRRLSKESPSEEGRVLAGHRPDQSIAENYSTYSV